MVNDKDKDNIIGQLTSIVGLSVSYILLCEDVRKRVCSYECCSVDMRGPDGECPKEDECDLWQAEYGRKGLKSYEK